MSQCRLKEDAPLMHKRTSLLIAISRCLLQAASRFRNRVEAAFHRKI